MSPDCHLAKRSTGQTSNREQLSVHWGTARWTDTPQERYSVNTCTYDENTNAAVLCAALLCLAFLSLHPYTRTRAQLFPSLLLRKRLQSLHKTRDSKHNPPTLPTPLLSPPTRPLSNHPPLSVHHSRMTSQSLRKWRWGKSRQLFLSSWSLRILTRMTGRTLSCVPSM